MNKLSVIIIALNEEKWIRNCLLSVKEIADELIVVIDDRTTDKTAQICKEFSAKIFERKWQGFSNTKNFAISKATNDWILFVDSDERVSKELAIQVKSLVIGNSPVKVYEMPRQNIILGKPMKYGGWWPDYVTRLVNKSNNPEWKGDLHEAIDTKVEKIRLTGVLYHLTHRGMQWMLETSQKYTQIEALNRFEKGHPKIEVWRLFRVMFTEFFDRLVVKSGWKDGAVGWIEAISQAFNMFLIYEQLWELQQGKSMEEKYLELDRELTKNGF